MLSKRIIPCLDVRNGRVVKGKKFQDIQDVDDPATLGKRYSDLGADELVFYDITASSEDRKISLDFVSDVAKNLNIPFCVGGGVETIEDFYDILRRGADKISVNSGAVKNPKLIQEASRKFGNQCVVLSIDAKRNEEGNYDVYIKGGRENTHMDAILWAIQGEALGAGELVINSIDADGMKEGYDLDLLKQITSAVNIPVIASGGAGKMEDFITCLKETDVDAVLAASVFHFQEIKISDLKERLSMENIPIRKVHW
ncbi:MAG: imidazole glycerol phosphate synthase subunit HisF [Acholeplasma sp.]|nr:MAG: imidazole glycerol phosphate synthase subunit HisF [Acholeplasma sp.]